MEKQSISSFAADNGFIWGPSPEIYGGVAGFYEYGPLGKRLKNRVEEVIREVFEKHEFWEVECPTVMPTAVWKASGHLEGFTDPLIRDEANGIHRADKLIEEWCLENKKDPSDLGVEGASHEHLLKIIKENNITANGKKLKPKIEHHNLMMKTQVGTNTEAFNRPETATTTYLPFKRFDDFFRGKYPFGVFQIGKAYRNEISPRQSVMRGREFTQAEGQLFILKEQKNSFPPFEEVKDLSLPLWFANEKKVTPCKLGKALKEGKLNNQAYAWTLALAHELFVSMGIPKEAIRMRQHHEDEKAFYADDAWDIELKLNSFGWYEVCGIHDRTDYDLSQHAKESKQALEAYNEEKKQKEVPHILEIAFGTDRPTFALLDLFLDTSDKEHTILKIPRALAPVQVAVFPLVNKLKDKARALYNEIQPQVSCIFDSSGSIGKRYYRADEKGVPLCITVDFEEDKCVTLRDRDSGKQVRTPIKDLQKAIPAFLQGADLSSLGKEISG